MRPSQRMGNSLGDASGVNDRKETNISLKDRRPQSKFHRDDTPHSITFCLAHVTDGRKGRTQSYGLYYIFQLYFHE